MPSGRSIEPTDRRLAYEAFRRADALCRASADPKPQDLLIRSEALRALGDPQAADADLARILDIGAFDPRLQATLLAIHTEPGHRDAAARTILAHPTAAADERAAALAHLVASRGTALEAVRDDDAVTGRITWRGRPRPSLEAIGESGALAIRVRDETVAAVPGTASARFAVDVSGEEAVGLVVARGGKPIESTTLGPVRKRPKQAPVVRDAATLSVVVPVYGGRALTRACLAALLAQTCRLRVEVVVVDDASPDPDLARETAETCRANGWRYLRHVVNAGFAAAVNRGLALARGGRLLLLNADAILPAGALDRLCAAAAQPDVGTVVPFSNDGGFTSFPAPRLRFPPPAPDEAGRIDAAASAANGGQIRDIPAGTAFCMLVTGACLDAVGGLDLGYGRGYFEDVDFALRARRLGFRNVVAADLYVVHVGGQSFGPDKRALVARNARLIQDRFPDYDGNWIAFLRADPLAPLRAAITRRLPLEEPVRIVAGRASRLGPLLARYGAAWGETSARILALDWTPDGTVRIVAADLGVPQDLAFRPDERQALADYLDRLPIVAIALAEPDATPDDLLALLTDGGRPVSILVADRAAAEAARGGANARLRGIPVVGTDAMAYAAIDGPTPTLRFASAARQPTTPAPGAEMPRIAALLPRPTPSALRLMTALARRLGRPPRVALVVLGACFDGIALTAMEHVHITGAMGDAADFQAALRHHGATHLLLPFRDGGFWLLEAARNGGPLPAAFFDWSGGVFHAAARDLMLDPSVDDDTAADAVARWSGPPVEGRAP